MVQKAHPDFFRFFFIQEHFQRYTTTIHHRDQPLYFYIPIVILGTLPWCAFLFQALKGKAGKWELKKLYRQEEISFLLVWAGFIFIFFSISSSKLIPYIAAVFLPLSLFQGRIFSIYDDKNERTVKKVFSWEQLPVIIQSLLFISVLATAPFLDKERPTIVLWWPWIVTPILLQIMFVFLPGYVKNKTGGNWFTTVYIICAIFLAVTILPITHFLTPYKSAYVLVQAISKYVPAGNELFQYNMSLYGIDFYGKMRTAIVNDIGEVGYGAGFLAPAERSRYFLDSEEFFKLCSQREIYCATKGEYNLKLLEKEVSHLTVLWNNNNYYLLKLGNIKN
jgi:4-amino-4-deoxy-L-arabinose transferase-like glycosyltransferase